ncbi:hypothetical protein DCE79_16700 [Lysinibacillus sp. 2017]|uniref:CHAT domain-containing protein n=1 Tax=Lysinibacillus sp. S2017 TaxID=2561923 RepID=UPI000D52A3E2|nr:CHAT domain-containing protein [Lysinibacillus sp. S2017]AWE08883.1 hypothetical protein DCE79_16700 [Lysinibacillus sp. 2017]TGN34757.1 CHAT domain-containing protein [Lysinibacillus sp. S2017]
MPTSSTIANTVLRKKKELSKLQSDKASEIKKVADLEKKITFARKSILRTKNSSTIQSKTREIERYNTQLSKVSQKISGIEKKIAQKSTEISAEESKLHREESREIKKRMEFEKKQLSEIENMQVSISKHEQLHHQTQTEIAELKNIPEKITVLFIASNPLDSHPLRLDEEAREIETKIRQSEYRNSIEFVTKWAARPLDILQGINEINPTIIHFSGHGSDEDQLVLQDNAGNAKFVSKEAIVQSMVTTSDDIKLVFFNTCFSYNQAYSVTEYLDAAIGMNTSIGDEAARVFSAQFYSALGFGYSVEKAFKQAKAALMLEGIEEENTPELYGKEGIDLKKLILVKP